MAASEEHGAQAGRKTRNAGRQADNAAAESAGRAFAEPRSIDGAKKALRKEVLARRALIPADERVAKSAAICEKLLATLRIKPGAVITVFSAFGDEVDLTAFVQAVGEHGARVCFPCMMRNPGYPDVTPKNRMVFRVVTRELLGEAPFVVKPLRSFWDDDPDLTAFPKVSPTEVDVAVVPLVAFDDNGGRLGYGGGNYDRFLPQMRSDAQVVGVAFAEQRADEVPRDAHDVALPRVVSA